MQFSIPIFNERIAPRCTVADSIVFGTVRRGRITYRHKIDLVVRSSMDLSSILMEHKAKVLVCGGIDRNTRGELEANHIAIIPNVSGSLEEVLEKIAEGRIPVADIDIQENPEADNKIPTPQFSEKVVLNKSISPNEKQPSYDEHAMLDVAYDINFEEERRLCRLSELVYFCLEMGYQSVGVAYCNDLAGPAETLVRVLRRFFLVHPVSCNPEDNTYRHSTHNSYCNPKLQANILNQLNTDLNVIVGLCIGADCIFSKHSDAPVTTLFVKDKALANNPIGAVYSDRYLKEASNPELQVLPDTVATTDETNTKRSIS